MAASPPRARFPALPQPALRSEMDKALLDKIEALASGKPAISLMDSNASPETMDKAVASYLAAARKSGLPPEHWRLGGASTGWTHSLYSPLPFFFSFHRGNASRTRAAQALVDAGCSLWHSTWQTSPYRAESAHDHHFLTPADIARFALSGADTPIRRFFLKTALADPQTPKALLSALRETYALATESVSATAKGMLGPKDKQAKAICSVIQGCSAELLAASKRRGWEDAKALVDESAALLAVKKEAPQTASPAAVKKAATAAQKSRLEALSSLLRDHPRDSEFILAGLGVSGWLKETPALACVKFNSRLPLLAIALEHASPAALEWLDAAGANPWLASAQMGQSNACAWAVNSMGDFRPGDDMAPLARMLLRGAWLDGAPNPKERCLELTKAAVEELAELYLDDEEDACAARALLASMEGLSIDEAIGEISSAPAKPSRRSAL